MSKKFYGKLNNQIMKQDQIIMNSEFFVNEVASKLEEKALELNS